MSLIIVRDIFDELRDENRRHLNELLFVEKCLKCLTEFKSFVDLIFNKIDVYLEENEISKYREFGSRFEVILTGRNNYLLKKYNDHFIH